MKYTEGAFRDWAYNVVTSEYNGKVLNDGTYLIENKSLILNSLSKIALPITSFNRSFCPRAT